MVKKDGRAIVMEVDPDTGTQVWYTLYGICYKGETRPLHDPKQIDHGSLL